MGLFLMPQKWHWGPKTGQKAQSTRSSELPVGRQSQAPPAWLLRDLLPQHHSSPLPSWEVREDWGRESWKASHPRPAFCGTFLGE